MTSALLDMIARDQAARPVDPKLLTEAEKDAKILALQARNAELEEIAEFITNIVVDVQVATLGAGANDRAYRRRILALCADLRYCAHPITRGQRETGIETFVGRAL